MILFKRIITCRCDYAIIHFFQQLIQSLDRIFSDLVNQSFGRDYPGEIQLFTFLDFVFNEDLHDKRFAHRGRCRITECTIIQLIINVFLRNKEALVPFRRDGQIITYECCVGFLLKRSFSIAGFICCSGNLCATEVADARKNRTGIICNILIVRLQFKKKRDDSLRPHFMIIGFCRMRGLGKKVCKSQSRLHIDLPCLLKSLKVQLQDGIVVEHIVVQNIEEVVIINASEYGIAELRFLDITHKTTAPFIT